MRIRIRKPLYGVPITFLGKWNAFEPIFTINEGCLIATQFKIVGFGKGLDGKDLSINGYRPYCRILIQKN